MAIRLTTGVTLAFAGSIFTASILRIAHTGMARQSVKTSHLSTSGGDTFTPGDLVDYGYIDVDFQTDMASAAKQPPITSAAVSITISFGSSTYVFSGFVESAEPFAGGIDELIEGRMRIKISGTPVHTP